jgi:hypothetical protein
MSLYLNCRPHLEAARAIQPDPSVPVWDFEFRDWPWTAAWRAFPASQIAVLETFIAEAPNCYLQMDPSDVLDWPQSKGWARPYKETFQLPPGLDATALTKAVLYLGGYRLYCAPAPVEPSLLSFDPWHSSPEESHEAIRRLGIAGLIAAHYDNDSWRISFSEPFSSATAG